jgi:DNA-binding transcriptional LysR family regulator
MTRPIDPVSLQHFVAVCEERSIARAAAREALVASALSKRLSALEAELGTPLLVRSRGGIEPTAAGEALLSRAREVLFALERLRTEVGEFAQGGVQGNVRVLASPSVLGERLPDDVAAFLAGHPGVRVRLDEAYSRDIVRAVREGQADLGVLWDVADLQGLQVQPYHTDRLCVAMAPGHALARRVSLTFADTLDQPSINVGPGGQLDGLLRRQAALLGRVPAYRMQVAALEAACRMVAAGLGLAVMPREATVPYAGAGRLVLLPLKETWAVRRFVLVARRSPAPTATTGLLASYLAGVAAKDMLAP